MLQAQISGSSGRHVLISTSPRALSGLSSSCVGGQRWVDSQEGGLEEIQASTTRLVLPDRVLPGVGAIQYTPRCLSDDSQGLTFRLEMGETVDEATVGLGLDGCVASSKMAVMEAEWLGHAALSSPQNLPPHRHAKSLFSMARWMARACSNASKI